MVEETAELLTLAAALPTHESGPIRNVLLQLWRAPVLHAVFRTAARFAPAAVRRFVQQERARVHDRERRVRIDTRRRLVPEQSLRALLSRGLRMLAEPHGRESLGDYLEFGVYNGTSLTCAYRELSALGASHVRLFGFDSFQGFPPSAAHEDRGIWKPGRCNSPLSFTTAVLESEGVDLDRVSLVPGWFTDTLNAETIHTHRLTKASVIMIDCDLYSSTKQALTFCAPLMAEQTLVLFDEWHIRGDEEALGEKKAFQEFLEEHPSFSAAPFGQYSNLSQAFLVTRRAPRRVDDDDSMQIVRRWLAENSASPDTTALVDAAVAKYGVPHVVNLALSAFAAGRDRASVLTAFASSLRALAGNDHDAT